MNINPLLLTDGYKLSHVRLYPTGTTKVYSNLTARKSRMAGVNDVIFFGLQYYIKRYLLESFQDDFFNQPQEKVVANYKRIVDNYLGKDAVSVDNLVALHSLGYLPLKIKALPEGTLVPIGVPMFTIVNTKPEFYWVTNFIESHLSDTVWGPCTSARTAFEYLRILTKYALKTTGSDAGVQWQAHDFSLRGMFGLEAAMMSGAAHLLSFTGTDSIPSICFLEKYYNADGDCELIGGSVPASEHSCVCAGGKEGELETYRYMIEDAFPSGIISVVSDTWDLWNVMTVILPELKSKIMAREGKLVVRPDSGSPVDILCGHNSHYAMPEGGFMIPHPSNKGGGKIIQDAERKGVVELLWDTFGGTVNEQGYKVLDSHVGAIYGDSITLERCEQICSRLEAKGFASTNVVLGVGSYSYQYVTRDTFGFAIKSTYAEVNGEAREIFKDPVTDDGTKKSLKGLLCVYMDNDGAITVKDQCSAEEERCGLLTTVFEDGDLVEDTALCDIRELVRSQL